MDAFPPPDTNDKPITWDEVIQSQMDTVRVLNQQSYILRAMTQRIQVLEDTIYKFLGVDDHGRIPGMPGYDGPLKEAIEEYQKLKNGQAPPAKSEDNPTGFGAYL